jgi:hypothetical protein
MLTSTSDSRTSRQLAISGWGKSSQLDLQLLRKRLPCVWAHGANTRSRKGLRCLPAIDGKLNDLQLWQLRRAPSDLEFDNNLELSWDNTVVNVYTKGGFALDNGNSEVSLYLHRIRRLTCMPHRSIRGHLLGLEQVESKPALST